MLFFKIPVDNFFTNNFWVSSSENKLVLQIRLPKNMRQFQEIQLAVVKLAEPQSETNPAQFSKTAK